MKLLTPAQEAALTADQIKPVWLLKLDLFSDSGEISLYLSDQAFTLWGQDWAPLVVSWGKVDHFFDPSERETQAADSVVELLNTSAALFAGAENISHYFRAYDLSRSTATIYLWIDVAGLTAPDGSSLNDLIPILTGKPEISSGVTPLLCPIDIVTHDGPYSFAECPWGELLKGRYTVNQWGSLPKENVGKYKPLVFGKDALVEGVALSGPDRVGEVSGPAGLFDPLTGSATVEIKYPVGGDRNDSNPYQPPCDIYIGDWRFPVTKPPVKTGDAWVYTIDTGISGVASCYMPTPLAGSTPLFIAAKDQLWSRSDETGGGPHSTSEPRSGAPYQFYHGGADSGNWQDGYHPGYFGRTIKNVYIDGVEVLPDDIFADHSFGVAWIFADQAALAGKTGNPEKIFLQWTAVDSGFTTGDYFLNPNQLTALYPNGYNADQNPCILGDFSIPASAGGAPVTTKLGLFNNPRYPAIGARIAKVRFVMRYTGLEFSTGMFNTELFGSAYSFAVAELADGAGIESAGWWVSKGYKGPEYEIWENNFGYPKEPVKPSVARVGYL